MSSETKRLNAEGEKRQEPGLQLLNELRRRSLWLVNLRWLVPPSIVVAALAAQASGFAFEIPSVVLTAVFILAYNLAFRFASRLIEGNGAQVHRAVHRFTYLQAGLDYASMFLLIYFTGGAASPLIFFFIFHIIFASILLPVLSAYGFAALATAGVALLAAGEWLGLLESHSVFFKGYEIRLAGNGYSLAVEVALLATTLFVTAFSTTKVAKMLRSRIVALAETSAAVEALNDKLNILYTVIKAAGSKQRLDQVLEITKGELARALDVRAVTVKLLSEDRRYLRYTAVFGLPEGFADGRAVEVAKSPLNRRIIEGEKFITGDASTIESFQFGEELAAAGFKSVLFVPLVVEEKVIGILGAYCSREDRFSDDEVEFFSLASGLLAMAIENARAYEAIENLNEERSRFMLQVAHNLRAPLAAVNGMLEVVGGNYLGDMNDSQKEYIRRIDRRIKTMSSMINELLVLAKSRSERHNPERVPVSFKILAGRIHRTFQEEARLKGVDFEVRTPDEMPEIRGDPDALEQMLENLVSNAVKYTTKGKVEVLFSVKDGPVMEIEVRDTGIGVPDDAIPDLFGEFFRARNARALEEIGTGLGLAMVKETVERHGGRIDVESKEGAGTTFVVRLPLDKAGNVV